MKNIISAIGIISIMAASVLADVNTNIKLDPIIDEVVSGKRILINAKIKDKAGIDIVRTYFKSSDVANYSFIKMNCKDINCAGTLPAPSASTKAIDYLILVKNSDDIVYKTQTFNAKLLPKDSKTPKYQMKPSMKAINVKTELAQAPEMVEGFTDNIVLDTAESTVRYGAVAGLFSGSGAGGAGAAATATGTTSAGTVAASGAISTTTMVVGGVVAAGAVGAAAGGGGGGGSSSSSSSSSSSLEGSSGDPRINLSWSNGNDLDLHVTDPCSNEISFTNTSATCNNFTGGIDVDTIPSSSSTSTSQENITWTNGAATGTYIVKIVDFTNNTGSSTSYTISKTNNGVTSTLTGTVSAGGTTTVTTFTH